MNQGDDERIRKPSPPKRAPSLGLYPSAPRPRSPHNPSAQQRAPALARGEQTRECGAAGSQVPLRRFPTWVAGGGARCGQHPLLRLGTALSPTPASARAPGQSWDRALGMWLPNVAPDRENPGVRHCCLRSCREQHGTTWDGQREQMLLRNVSDTFGMCRACHLHSAQMLRS